MTTATAMIEPSVLDTLPTRAELELRLSRALQEVDVCQRLLPVVSRADQLRQVRQRAGAARRRQTG